MMKKRTFDMFVEVIAACSRRDTRFKTPKQIVVYGFDLLIRASVVDRFYALKTYKAEEHRGPLPQFFQFEGIEKQLVHETRALLQEQSGIKVSTADAIVLAILAAARALDIRP